MRLGPAGWTWAAGLAAAVAAVPFLRGLLRGESFYFRDLAGQFLPLRRFVVEGLRAGELRFWNPYVHEGVPLAEPPLSYPLDLLHLWLDGYAGISLGLALHVPAAAAAFVLLCRSFGLAPRAGFVGGVVYALGGFALSTLNLYIYVKTLAWAPLLVLAMRAAVLGGRRALAGLALVTGIALSTAGAEIFVQAVVIGLALALCRQAHDGRVIGHAGTRSRRATGRLQPFARRVAHLGLGLVLGLALCAPTVLALHDLTTHSARAAGFPADVTLAQSIHPLSWPQVVIADFHGELDDSVARWWGDNFFSQGFPYVLSLYLGAAVLVLAVLGATSGSGPRWVLLALSGLAILVALGRYAGWQPLVEALPLVRMFRYPVKVYFTVHFCVALLAALGLDALLRDEAHAAWRRLRLGALAAGGLLLSVPALPKLFPGTTLWFVAGYFPPRLDLAARYERLASMTADAAAGGAVALAAGGLAWLVCARRLRPSLGAAAVAALVAGDLLRAGAGLNPTVTPAFFETSPEMTAEAAALRRADARIFTCHVPESRAYLRRRSQLPGRHEFFTFALLRETLSPNTNVAQRVPSALSIDLTMLVPPGQVLEPGEASCRDVDALVPRLRAAAVTHVLSLDPLVHPALRFRSRVAPRGIAPLAVHVYALADPLPYAEAGAAGAVVARRDAPGRIVVDVDVVTPARLVIREGWDRGWQARLDGRLTPVRRSGGHHMAVDVPSGRSRLSLTYRPPTWQRGLSIATLAALAVLALLVPWPRRAPQVP